MKALSNLDEYGFDVLDTENFEKLVGVKDPKIYSIRYSHSPKNPRVLFAYFDGKKVVLLSAMKEESANNNKDYNNVIDKVKNRYKTIERELKKL